MTRSSLLSTFRTFALLLASLAWLGCTPEDAKEGADGGDAPAGDTGGDGAVAKVAAPLSPGSSEIAAYLTIPNLEAALEGVAEIVKAVTPKPAEALGKDQLKAQLGLMLGDPQLDNFYVQYH